MYRKGAPLPGFSTTAVTVLSLFLVLTSVLAIALLPAELILFQPEAYLRALDHQQFYEQFPRRLAGAMLANPDGLTVPGLRGSPVEYLDQDDAAAVLEEMLPADWTRAQTEGIIENFGSFANFEREDLTLPLDLTDFKGRLAGDEGTAAARSLIRSWPDCSAQDAASIAEQMLRGDLRGLPVCRPPELLLPVFEGTVKTALAGLSIMLPDRLDLAQPLTGDVSAQGLRGPLIPQFWTFFRWYSWLRWLFRLAPVLALSFLIWITLLTVRSLPYLFHSLGQPLLQAGLISAFLAAFMLLVGNQLFSSLIARSVPLLPQAFDTPVALVLQEVWSRTSVWTLYASLAVIAAAVVFLVLERALTPPD